mmetsp:Transcript_81222/g.224845  ORF Transcript_81222/g.224845 Transcript_81222/m.224845 type:complete len:313 (-) Transcript_81222:1080-2018(-)
MSLLSSAAPASPSSRTSAWNFPAFPRARSAAGVSNSATRPDSRNRIRSLLAIVFSRCAMVSTVLSTNCVLMTSWIVASVRTSMFAVASSMQMIRDCRNSARARQTSCLSPQEKFSPPSLTLASRQPGRFCTMASREAWRSAVQSWSSVRSLKRSRFSRTVPANMTASWGMIARPRRRSRSPNFAMSTPSIRIWPSPRPSGEAMSTKRKSTARSVDLPQPVRPQMPTFMPPSITTEIPSSTLGRPGRYCIATSTNSTRPADGHTFGGRHSVIRGASGSTSVAYSWMRSAEVIRASVSVIMRMVKFNIPEALRA